MSVFGLQWKDTYDVCIIGLFLSSNRLGYKWSAHKKESFHEKCFCACVCDRPPSVGEDYYLIIRQACSIWSPLKRKNNRGKPGMSMRAGESESDRATERQRILTREGHERKSPCLTTPVTFNFSAQQKKRNERGKKSENLILSLSIQVYNSVPKTQWAAYICRLFRHHTKRKINFLINIFVLFSSINI